MYFISRIFTSILHTVALSGRFQHPTGWFSWNARPAGLYRFTQGLHVVTGIASVPLLFAKLWSVFPRLFQWPLATSVVHAVERLSLLPLIGGSLFMLVTGVANIELWYPWVFFFPAGHYAVKWRPDAGTAWKSAGSVDIGTSGEWKLIVGKSGARVSKM